MQEIERKFLISGFPELPLLEEAVVWQGYLSTQPVVRIRKKESVNGTDYVLCFKGKGTLCRKEIELDLTQDIFDELHELLEAPMIRKDYKVYALDGYRLECSLVDCGTPTEFLFAEVEFASMEEAKAFVPPAFLSNEVTEDLYYSMGRYWQRKCEALRSNTE
ncbi:CYTH domain-containing protein [Anaeromassilibacillus senegalensis]|uniref:CYTH domain-containing protein n=1 Tax=Anaeromassilibacillus senegalensis TaxID=1673717 RepID=UPI0006800938|nr:CYTH domain-containing protein [Anaeromassilibacillus senegalensis]